MNPRLISTLNRHRGRGGVAFRHAPRPAAVWCVATEVADCFDDRSYDDDDYDDYWYSDGDYPDIVRFAVDILLRGQFQPRIALPEPLTIQPPNGDSSNDDSARASADPSALEQAAHYLSALGESLWNWPIPPSVEAGLIALSAHPFFQNNHPVPPKHWMKSLLAQVLILHPFWLRRVEDWQPRQGDLPGELVNLVRHLLVRYPLPAWLDPDPARRALQTVPRPDWLDEPAEAPPVAPLQWLPFLAAGRGWSLVDALKKTWPEKMPLPANSAIARHASRAPAAATLQQVRFWILIHSLGGDQQLYEDLHELIHIGETTLINSLVPWLQKHRRELPAEAIQPVATWALHEFTEAERSQEPQGPVPQPFSMKGRSPSRVLQAIADYQQQLNANSTYHLRWPGQGWDWEVLHGDQKWTLRELCTGAELHQESAAMHHCVAMYAHYCVQGISAIFSLCADGHRKVTLEYRPATGQIVQVHGIANRLPTATEMAVINLWQTAKLPRAKPPSGS